MSKDNKNINDNNVVEDKHQESEKVKRAISIAERRESFKDTYKSLNESITRIVGWFSKTIDKFLFTRKYDKLISLLIAGILYMTINFSNTGLLALDSTYTIKNHNVTLNADLDIYEVVGFDTRVDVVLTGKSSDVNAAKSQSNTKVVLDLSGLQTGEHTVKYTPVNFSNRVNVTTKPETVTIKIRKKETVKFNITHDYLNLNKLDDKYFPETPIFESSEVLVRASAQTIDSIAYVKALIDVKGATETFTTEAPLYAYDVNGEKIDVDIIPKIIKVEVPISSPKKTVAIRVIPNGIIPNNKSIESITLDHSSIDLYGLQSILDKTDEIKINIDASKLDRDIKIYENIILPNGIRHASISKVNIDIKLTDTESKVLKGIPVAFSNNINGYKTRLDNPDQSEIDVTIYGSESILENITEDNFGRIYFDMADVEPGHYTFALLVDTNHYLINYELAFEDISMEVVGN